MSTIIRRHFFKSFHKEATKLPTGRSHSCFPTGFLKGHTKLISGRFCLRSCSCCSLSAIIFYLFRFRPPRVNLACLLFGAPLLPAPPTLERAFPVASLGSSAYVTFRLKRITAPPTNSRGFNVFYIKLDALGRIVDRPLSGYHLVFIHCSCFVSLAVKLFVLRPHHLLLDQLTLNT